MSTSATSQSHLDRKTLRRPDEFFASVRSFFDGLAKNSRAVIVIFGLVLLSTAAIAYFQARREAQAGVGRNELYLAKQAVDQELVAFAAADPQWKAQAAKTLAERKKALEKNAPKNPKDKKAAEESVQEEKPTADAVAFRKMDVDAVVPEGVKKLRAVIEKHSGTRSGFEARLALGDLYFNHGQADKAVPLYEEATKSSPGTMEKALAFYSLGYAQEGSGKFEQAQQSFDRALSMGETGLRGELLLSVARVQEARGQKDEAKKTYDRIVSELPNSDYSRSAETYRAELQ